MSKRVMLVGVFCFISSNAWVCFAGCKAECTAETITYDGCTPAQVRAIREVCNDGDEGRAVDPPATTTTTTTTTTIVPSAVTTTTLAQPYGEYLRDCRWYSKDGQRFKHCTISGYLSAQCGGGHKRRDGSVTYRFCVVRN